MTKRLAQRAKVIGAGISSAVAVGRAQLPRAIAPPTVRASTAASETAYQRTCANMPVAVPTPFPSAVKGALPIGLNRDSANDVLIQTLDKPRVEPTMSSREIAALYGKSHTEVLSDIAMELAEIHGEASVSRFGGRYIADGLLIDECFHLPRREALAIAHRYEASSTAAECRD